MYSKASLGVGKALWSVDQIPEMFDMNLLLIPIQKPLLINEALAVELSLSLALFLCLLSSAIPLANKYRRELFDKNLKLISPLISAVECLCLCLMSLMGSHALGFPRICVSKAEALNSPLCVC